jgi:hypothetical protein
VTRAEKTAVLMEAWEQRLFLAYGVAPRAIDRQDRERELRRTKDSQLDAMIRGYGLDQPHGPVW